MTLAFVRYGLLIVLSLLMPGMINKVKALWAGRQGPPILQPLYDMIKLLRKSEVISTTTSAVFVMAPAVSLASVLCAACVVPITGKSALIGFNGDFVFFAYMLALGRFFTVIGALDTGSGFEGMGASREVTFSALFEPAFFVVMGSLAMLTGTTSFTDIFSRILVEVESAKNLGFFESIPLTYKAWFGSSSYLFVPAVCGNIVFLIMILVESCRMPVDDPTTHLELTMIHEVMVLDNSGPDLAMIHLAAAVKMGVISTLITGLIIPSSIHSWAALVLYVILMAIIVVMVGTVESLMARLRMTHVPQFVMGASSIALLVLAVLMLGGGK